MSPIFVLIPFLAVVVLVSLFSSVLRTRKTTAHSAEIDVDSYQGFNIVTPDAIIKVNGLSSYPNEPLRGNEFETCLEYLCAQDTRVSEDGRNNENIILSCLDGKI